MEFIIGGLVIVIFIGLYIFSYSLNQSIEKPEGTKDIDCKGCNAINCRDRKNDFRE
ncbi:MAG: hypothetical protein ACOCV1_06405 [Bacillota bacterium]